MKFVDTSYVMISNGDIQIVRNIPIYDILFTMISSSNVEYMRFNHRKNIFYLCDTGYYMNREKAHVFFRTIKLKNMTLTRSVCYSDMLFITTTNFVNNRVIPLRLKYNTTYPETAVQQEIAKNPGKWGTYIYDGRRSNAVCKHLNGRFYLA